MDPWILHDKVIFRFLILLKLDEVIGLYYRGYAVEDNILLMLTQWLIDFDLNLFY